MEELGIVHLFYLPQFNQHYAFILDEESYLDENEEWENVVCVPVTIDEHGIQKAERLLEDNEWEAVIALYEEKGMVC